MHACDCHKAQATTGHTHTSPAETAQLQQVRLELKTREEVLSHIEETRDDLVIQLRETKLTVMGLEGEQRRQKSITPSPIKETVEGYDFP